MNWLIKLLGGYTREEMEDVEWANSTLQVWIEGLNHQLKAATPYRVKGRFAKRPE